MHKTTTRPATPADFEPLFELHKQALGQYVEQIWGWDEEQQVKMSRDRFDQGEYEILQRDSRDVGCIRVRRDPDAIHLNYITIAPEFQNKGIGTQIVNGLIEECRALRVPLKLSVLKVNPATRLYERLGFKIVGDDEHRYLMEWRGEDSQ